MGYAVCSTRRRRIYKLLEIMATQTIKAQKDNVSATNIEQVVYTSEYHLGPFSPGFVPGLFR